MCSRDAGIGEGELSNKYDTEIHTLHRETHRKRVRDTWANSTPVVAKFKAMPSSQYRRYANKKGPICLQNENQKK